MKNPYKICTEIVQLLISKGITPVVYGSVGLSMHVGLYKEPDDIDLLVDARWLNTDWSDLCAIVAERGYRLNNEHEHEFINERGEKIAFAEIDVLKRDHICDPQHDLINVNCAGQQITTLNLQGFLAAYRFSQADGYRQSHRALKDTHVISIIETAINKK